MFCVHCEKVVDTKVKITHRFLGATSYERTVCVLCESEMVTSEPIAQLDRVQASEA